MFGKIITHLSTIPWQLFVPICQADIFCELSIVYFEVFLRCLIHLQNEVTLFVRIGAELAYTASHSIRSVRISVLNSMLTLIYSSTLATS